ncbi:hypothetical protein [Oleiagrimonas sp.]|jgi:SAM-dependent methyltransferase|uniref:hypothetical protein n=1 Tax=Oleiagrimonas sp. TaxID=2010330 RepID=UPI002607124D|nr:hypothetical protein [Oleiagrimonas sp.]MDA3913389.1 hypothetical protein [Oleiagrimonas sp.]
MGIDKHSLNLLRYVTENHGKLGRVITLGRQAIHLGPRASRKWIESGSDGYCESLLTGSFGAIHVDSIDNSDYEGATIVADMNLAIPESIRELYDTVIDLGCTEHIYDVVQSLRNVASLCKPGGTILHAVPANGFCGHGFYQFSPELFFSRYSKSNGFTDTEIFLAELCDIHHWYRVSPPQDGKRINVRSPDELYVLVITRRIAHVSDNVQQSDYEFTWEEQSGQQRPTHAQGRLAWAREILDANRLTARLVNRVDAWLAPNGVKQLRSHPALQRVTVAMP